MMDSMDNLPRRDLELLSAYIDGDLPARQVAALERRLEDEPNLRRAMEEMRETVRLLHSLPALDPPRSYALTPEMAGLREPPPSYPVLRLATALAALAFFVVVGLDAISGMALGAARETSQLPPAAGEIMQMQDVTERAAAADEQEQDPSKSVEMPEAPAAAGEMQVEAEAQETVPQPTRTPCDACPDAYAEEAPQEEEERALSAAPEERPEDQPELEGAQPETPPATAEPSPSPADSAQPALATPAPTPTLEMQAPEPQPTFWTSLRVVEAGLAGLTLLLAGLTLYIRKRI